MMGLPKKYPSGKPIPKRLRKKYKEERKKMVRRTKKGRRTKR